MDKHRGIGNKGDLPWPKLKGDMKFFRELTTCPDREAVEKRWGLKAGESAEVHAWSEVLGMLKFAHPLPEASIPNLNLVIMGRKTWDSLPPPYRPLSLRANYILTRKGIEQETLNPSEDPLHIGPYIGPFLHSMRMIETDIYTREYHVIGGGQIFAKALEHQLCRYLYVTEIDAEFECDTHFPETPDFRPALSSPWVEENGIRYRFRRYDRVS